MALTIKSSNANRKKDVPTEGTKMARLVGLTDLGHQPGYEYNGEFVKSNYKITFTFELPHSRTEDGRPHWVSKDVNVSDFVGDGVISGMMKIVYALDPTGEVSNNGKDLVKLIGRPCMVNIRHNKNGYPVIKDIVAAPEGLEVPPLENDPQVFDMDNPDLELFNKFPEFIQNKIKSALNFEETKLYQALLEQSNNDEEVPFRDGIEEDLPY